MDRITEEPSLQDSLIEQRPAWQVAIEEEAARWLARIAEHKLREQVIPEGSGPDDYQGA